MNFGATELGALGILLMIVFGLKLGSRKSSTPKTLPHSETNTQADFQNSNIDYEKSSTNKK